MHQYKLKMSSKPCFVFSAASGKLLSDMLKGSITGSAALCMAIFSFPAMSSRDDSYSGVTSVVTTPAHRSNQASF